MFKRFVKKKERTQPIANQPGEDESTEIGKKQKASSTEIKIVSCLVIVQNHFVDICRPWLEEVELVQNQHW